MLPDLASLSLHYPSIATTRADGPRFNLDEVFLEAAVARTRLPMTGSDINTMVVSPDKPSSESAGTYIRWIKRRLEGSNNMQNTVLRLITPLGEFGKKTLLTSAFVDAIYKFLQTCQLHVFVSLFMMFSPVWHTDPRGDIYSAQALIPELSEKAWMQLVEVLLWRHFHHGKFNREIPLPNIAAFETRSYQSFQTLTSDLQRTIETFALVPFISAAGGTIYSLAFRDAHSVALSSASAFHGFIQLQILVMLYDMHPSNEHNEKAVHMVHTYDVNHMTPLKAEAPFASHHVQIDKVDDTLRQRIDRILTVYSTKHIDWRDLDHDIVSAAPRHAAEVSTWVEISGQTHSYKPPTAEGFKMGTRPRLLECLIYLSLMGHQFKSIENQMRLFVAELVAEGKPLLNEEIRPNEMAGVVIRIKESGLFDGIGKEMKALVDKRVSASVDLLLMPMTAGHKLKVLLISDTWGKPLLMSWQTFDKTKFAPGAQFYGLGLALPHIVDSVEQVAVAALMLLRNDDDVQLKSTDSNSELTISATYNIHPLEWGETDDVRWTSPPPNVLLKRALVFIDNTEKLDVLLKGIRVAAVILNAKAKYRLEDARGYTTRISAIHPLGMSDVGMNCILARLKLITDDVWSATDSFEAALAELTKWPHNDYMHIKSLREWAEKEIHRLFTTGYGKKEAGESFIRQQGMQQARESFIRQQDDESSMQVAGQNLHNEIADRTQQKRTRTHDDEHDAKRVSTAANFGQMCRSDGSILYVGHVNQKGQPHGFGIGRCEGLALVGEWLHGKHVKSHRT